MQVVIFVLCSILNLLMSRSSTICRYFSEFERSFAWILRSSCYLRIIIVFFEKKIVFKKCQASKNSSQVKPLKFLVTSSQVKSSQSHVTGLFQCVISWESINGVESHMMAYLLQRILSVENYYFFVSIWLETWSPGPGLIIWLDRLRKHHAQKGFPD